MSASEEINAKLDWLVEAVKYLLNQSAGAALPFGAQDEDAWLDEGLPDPNEHLAVRPQPKVAEAVCNHQHQVNVKGVIRCANCGKSLIHSGVVGDPKTQRTALHAEWGQFSRSDAAMNGRFGDDD